MSTFFSLRTFRSKRARRNAALWLALAVALAGWAAYTNFAVEIADWIGALRAYDHWASDAQIIAAVMLAVAAAQITGFDRFLWHMLANVTAFETPRPLAKPWVIDGDTIDDRATGIRYRLANIDAPETGDNAKCFHERSRGEEASRAAIQIVRSAQRVEVRRTWRTDVYGRRVAFVLVDGADLGETLMRQGLARPWRGRRERWCGGRGGLAKIAASGARAHSCGTCRAWR